MLKTPCVGGYDAEFLSYVFHKPFSRGLCFSLIEVCFYRGHAVAVSLWV